MTKKAACVRLHSGTKGSSLVWTSLWEFAPFEMQIPHRAERAGETGARGSVLVRWWAAE